MKCMPRLLPAVLAAGLAAPAAQSRITAPKEAVGFNFGDDLHRAQPHGTFKVLFNSLY